MQRRLFVFAVLVLIGGVPLLASAQAVMREEPITLVTDISSATFNAEVASTPEEQERGLMFRQVMPADQAMLFDFNPPKPVQMWMKNTLVSLDMLFVRADGSIAAIAQNTVPNSLDIISVQEPVRGVVELAAGTAKHLALKTGDHVVNRIFSPQLN